MTISSWSPSESATFNQQEETNHLLSRSHHFELASPPVLLATRNDSLYQQMKIFHWTLMGVYLGSCWSTVQKKQEWAAQAQAMPIKSLWDALRFSYQVNEIHRSKKGPFSCNCRLLNYIKHKESCACWLMRCMRITGDGFNFYNQLMCNQLPQLYTIIFSSDNVNDHKSMALMILSTPYNNGQHKIKSCPSNPCGTHYDFHIKEIKYTD